MSAASDGLTWRTLIPSHDPRFMVKGTELSCALFGLHLRFALIEVRCYDADGSADRKYRVRDATLVSDDDLRAGKRSPIVWEGPDYEAALRMVERLSVAT